MLLKIRYRYWILYGMVQLSIQLMGLALRDRLGIYTIINTFSYIYCNGVRLHFFMMTRLEMLCLLFCRCLKHCTHRRAYGMLFSLSSFQIKHDTHLQVRDRY